MHLKIFISKKEKDDDDEHFKMIDGLDDILQIIKKHGKVKKRRRTDI
jgi:hypothetical protein